MKTLANINDNINIKFNKTMTTISENAESQQVAGNRAEEMMASAIAHEAKMAEIKDRRGAGGENESSHYQNQTRRECQNVPHAGESDCGRGYHPDRDHPCRRGWMRLRVVRNP